MALEYDWDDIPNSTSDEVPQLSENVASLRIENDEKQLEFVEEFDDDDADEIEEPVTHAAAFNYYDDDDDNNSDSGKEEERAEVRLPTWRHKDSPTVTKYKVNANVAKGDEKHYWEGKVQYQYWLDFKMPAKKKTRDEIMKETYKRQKKIATHLNKMGRGKWNKQLTDLYTELDEYLKKTIDNGQAKATDNGQAKAAIEDVQMIKGSTLQIRKTTIPQGTSVQRDAHEGDVTLQMKRGGMNLTVTDANGKIENTYVATGKSVFVPNGSSYEIENKENAEIEIVSTQGV